jgi:hypothetical protein
MLTREQAEALRELIAQYGNHQFNAGRLDRRHDHEKRAKVAAASDAATRALCAALTAVTMEIAENELS